MGDNLILTEYTIRSGLPEPLTLALAADFHEREPEEVLRVLRQQRPDLIMIAGDTLERYSNSRESRIQHDDEIVTRIIRSISILLDDLLEFVLGKRTHDSEHAFHFLQEAVKISPVFMSRGNHEWYLLPEDVDRICETKVTLLDNADCEIHFKGMKIRIGGLSPVPDLDWLEAYCRKDGYKILLCHHPEFYERYLLGRHIDLILAGHAHGGQIRIFNRGIYSPGQGLLPRYTKGIYDGRLVVTTGCSNTASVPRLGNPCEVVLIHLK